MAEVLIESPVTLTEGAYTELKKLITEKNIPGNFFLRVGVKGGGCAGLSYWVSIAKSITIRYTSLKTLPFLWIRHRECIWWVWKSIL